MNKIFEIFIASLLLFEFSAAKTPNEKSFHQFITSWFDIQSHNLDQYYGPYRLDDDDHCQYYQQGIFVNLINYKN